VANQEKWYFKTWALVVSFLLVGPFMLPLVWSNSSFSIRVKITITACIIIATILLSSLFVYTLKLLGNSYKEMLQ